MADGRMLTRRIVMSQKFDAVTEEDEGAGLLYVLLLPFTDRDGRIEGSESVVRSLVYPRKDSVSIAKIGKRLSLLRDHGLIVWYEIDGEKYIQITKFKSGQKNMRYDREAESIIPSPETNKINSGSTPDQLRSDSGSSPVEEKRREEKFKRNLREEKVITNPLSILIAHWNSKENLPVCKYTAIDIPNASAIADKIRIFGIDDIKKAIDNLSKYWEDEEAGYRPSSLDRFLVKSLDRWLDTAEPGKRYDGKWKRASLEEVLDGLHD